ncbi:MAG: sulfatase-like hydrolase/transferase, partial [Armatimonadetes bacterium]|nr:sulfatase-like hydrolase/transferase [Armatimonadota bacterium]
MNLIIIVLDSFRQDHVSAYHGGRGPFPDVPSCQTPNLDAFARQAVMLDNVYPDALPTIPVRMQLMTGQRTLPYRPWQPLALHDVTIAEILRREGYVCGLISDTYHYRAPGMNYHRGFHAYHWVRGQEYDPYESAPTRRNIGAYVNEHYPEAWQGRIAQYLANTDDLQAEERRFPAQVVERAVEWLARNRSHPHLFLWIDSFDPHEP